MKILLISSSSRKGKSQTFLLAKEALRGVAINKDVESETIHLCDLKIEFCRHLEACQLSLQEVDRMRSINTGKIKVGYEEGGELEWQSI